MPGFVQIVEFRSSKIDELRALSDEFERDRSDAGLVHGVVTQDRDDPTLYRTIVEFRPTRWRWRTPRGRRSASSPRLSNLSRASGQGSSRN